MTTDISNSDNVVDSRDILERIAELEEEMEEYQEERRLRKLDLQKPSKRWQEWDGLDELKQLKNVESQADGYGDWKYGEALIRDDYFTEYIEELIEDCYMTSEMRDMMSQWPWRHLDMETAAKEAKQDYTEIDWDGVIYWMRA